MQLSPSQMLEWHILETAKRPLLSSAPAIHMGPFSSEQECRTVLASLSTLPAFDHRCLEVRQQARRREKRIGIKLPIRISRLDVPRHEWATHTLDISACGARLSGSAHVLRPGELVVIRYGQRESVFRVAWVGLPASPDSGQAGVECLSPEVNLWNLDLSDPSTGRPEPEPLHHQMAVAQAVQRKLFPREKPPLRTLEYCGKCIQAQTVGGDYYDFLDMGSGRVGLVIADVAGKGVAAALLMANLQGSIHNRPDISIADLPTLLSSLNLHLYKHTEPDRYASLFFGCYNDYSRTLAYVNCGHSPALLVRPQGEMTRLDATATVLGLFPRWECSVRQVLLRPGDVLSIFTDGLTETTAPGGDEFGEACLMQLLQRCAARSSQEILDDIEQALQNFRQSEHVQDDLTLLIARSLE